MFASSRTIPAPFPLKVAFFGHIVFKQLQVHSFYIVYALSTSYIHWPVVSDHFASCLDHFPAQFALFLPCMSSPQTFKKKTFFWSRKTAFSAATKNALAPISHTATIQTGQNHNTPTTTEHNRLVVKVFQTLLRFRYRFLVQTLEPSYQRGDVPFNEVDTPNPFKRVTAGASCPSMGIRSISGKKESSIGYLTEPRGRSKVLLEGVTSPVKILYICPVTHLVYSHLHWSSV